jgi:hypothetical protein
MDALKNLIKNSATGGDSSSAPRPSSAAASAAPLFRPASAAASLASHKVSRYMATVCLYADVYFTFYNSLFPQRTHILQTLNQLYVGTGRNQPQHAKSIHGEFGVVDPEGVEVQVNVKQLELMGKVIEGGRWLVSFPSLSLSLSPSAYHLHTHFSFFMSHSLSLSLSLFHTHTHKNKTGRKWQRREGPSHY